MEITFKPTMKLKKMKVRQLIKERTKTQGITEYGTPAYNKELVVTAMRYISIIDRLLQEK